MTLDQLLSKAFNGKAENIVISKNIIMFHLDGVETRINLVSFIDQIFNDHEAIVKAKDEEIAELKWDFETQKKSAMEMYCKNENIDMLKESESHFFHALIDERQQRLSLFDCLKKERKKARSIVAMLFWRAKKDKRLADEENKYFTYDMALHSFILFKQAYKMLKDNQ